MCTFGYVGGLALLTVKAAQSIRKVDHDDICNHRPNDPSQRCQQRIGGPTQGAEGAPWKQCLSDLLDGQAEEEAHEKIVDYEVHGNIMTPEVPTLEKRMMSSLHVRLLIHIYPYHGDEDAGDQRNGILLYQLNGNSQMPPPTITFHMFFVHDVEAEGLMHYLRVDLLRQLLPWCFHDLLILRRVTIVQVGVRHQDKIVEASFKSADEGAGIFRMGQDCHQILICDQGCQGSCNSGCAISVLPWCDEHSEESNSRLG
mmetsp:Transcript_61036/g.108529  ORF Transcript_61036/g.108529 Transcript_61036/m.108529 type:complete len:256 (-) Transcript_61036:1564-2331(-)